MTFSYSKLFTIELLHEYFLNGKCAGLEMIASEDCKTFAKNMGILFRNRENLLVSLIKDNGSNEPFINNGSKPFFRKYYKDTVLRFYIVVADPQFFNYTNIEFPYGNSKKFYFNNLSKNAENGFFYLTTPVREYTAGTTYLPGNLARNAADGSIYESIKKNPAKKKTELTDKQLWAPKGLLQSAKTVEDFKAKKFYQQGDLVKDTAGNIYQSAKNHTAGDKKELSDAAIWIAREQGQLEYVTDEDMIDYSNGHYQFNLAEPVTKASIAVSRFNFDAAKPAFDQQTDISTQLNFEDKVSQVSIDLSSLTPGKYAVTVNKETKLVYYDPLMPGNTLGVIEIFNHLPEKDDFSLLTDKEKIKNTPYHIQFSTRSVLWKYVIKDGRASKISDTGDNKYVFNADGDSFVSAAPIPLFEKALKTLKLEFGAGDFIMSPLPNPDIKTLGKCTQNEYDYLCSEVYLNY